MIKKAEITKEKEDQAEESRKKELSEQVYKESTHENVEDIFSKEDLTCSDIIKIRRWLRQNEKDRNSFKKKVKRGISGRIFSEDLIEERTGFALWVVDEMGSALEHLKQANTPLGHYFIAMHRKRTENALGALSYIESVSDDVKKDKNIAGLQVKLMYELNRIQEAEKIVDFLEKEYPDEIESMKARALFLKETGSQQEAADLFETVLEQEPADEETLFYLGALLDRFGNDDQALVYMQKAAEIFPAHRNAVLNLGQMYHELGDTERAVFCFKRVLKQEPDNKMARKHLRDVEATENMYYDEEKAKEREELNKKLQIPVSDFELSVRSRNCLKRMDIKVLGDLIQKTEEDLLSYKNFGETSLAEIKRMLASKDLYLGQAKDMKNKELKEKQQRKIIDVTDSELLKKNVSDLELSVRARKCLDSMDVETFGDLIQYDDNSLLKVRNFGQTSLNEIKQKLASYGLSLANE